MEEMFQTTEYRLAEIDDTKHHTIRIEPDWLNQGEIKIQIAEGLKAESDLPEIYKGTLTELCNLISEGKRLAEALVEAKKQIRALEEEISILKDNQVHEPVH